MKLSQPAIGSIESAINRYLALDPDTCRRMAALEGSSVGLDLRGLDLQLFVLPHSQGIRLLGSLEQEPDAVLHGTPLAMANLGLGGNTEKTLFSGDVRISGDVETGQAFKAVLDAMDIDWEEQLAGLTGDVVAHQLGNMARRARDFLQRGRATLAQDTGEYLKEELRVLPSRIEVENFSRDVAGIRSATDRLAARVQRLREACTDREDA